MRRGELHLCSKEEVSKMSKKKIEHVVFDGLRKLKSNIPIRKINRNTAKKYPIINSGIRVRNRGGKNVIITGFESDFLL